MTDPSSARSDFLARLGLALATGALLALLTSIVPVATIAITLVLAALAIIAVRQGKSRRGVALAGTIAGAGLCLLVLGANTAVRCSQTDDFCGDTNVAPLLIYAICLLAVGASASVVVARRWRANP